VGLENARTDWLYGKPIKPIIAYTLPDVNLNGLIAAESDSKAPNKQQPQPAMEQVADICEVCLLMHCDASVALVS